MEAASQKTTSTILWGIPVAVIILAIVGFIIAGNIANPLKQVTRTAELIANGDLSETIASARRTDEVGALMQSFNKMIIMLRKQNQEILKGVNILASTSSQILTSTTQIGTGSAAISETTTTVEEVRQAALLSSQKAKNLSDSANKVAQVSLNGQKAVDDTVEGMNNISKQMDEIAQTVILLSEQSQSIGGIIASVTDLAGQSNLLAVNAAIEAAKAGEQGKGFAVVAQEIRNLAEQSKQATMQVRKILNDVQKATSAAVLATEQGNRAVEAGVKKSVQAGEAIRSLTESSAEAVQVSTQISASSQQQLIGMDQIGIAMQNINQAGLDTSVSMTQAEEALKNLHDLGQKLKDLVEQFKM
jgi:methyl-accepting chemotaxis protein